LAGGGAFARDSGGPSSFPAEGFAPVYADAAPASEQAPADETTRPLMGFLKTTTIGQSLENNRVNIYGWIEGSYEYNFNVRDRGPNIGRTFDVLENNKGYLNQVDLTFEKKANLTGAGWDVGGRVDIMYGSDSRFTTSSDLLSHQGDENSFGLGRQEAWLDIPQAYIDIAIPVLNGMRLRIGKFEFFKVVNPNANALYTHPFEYGQAFPYSLTGISAYTPLTTDLSVEGGVSRGWDQTLTDNNSAALDGFGRVIWNLSDVLRISAAVISGPEQYHDNGHFTTTANVSVLYTPIDQFAFVLDAICGHQAGAVFGDFPGSNAAPTVPLKIGGANWYGLTGTAAYKLNDWVTLNGRMEWYRDEEGYTEGFPGQLNLYETAIGLKLTPLSSTAIGDNFILRPEIRYDYSSRAFFNVADPRHDQVTFAIDAIVNF
jgi:hypothetical protein